MAFSLNKIMLIGNLGKDSETRFATNSDTAITRFTMATTHSYKNRDGNWTEETTWHNVVGFNQSDFMKNALRKGAKFYVEGRISIRDYTDKEGQQKRFTEVVAERLIPLDSREARENLGGNTGTNNYDTAPPPESDSSGDDDLPF